MNFLNFIIFEDVKRKCKINFYEFKFDHVAAGTARNINELLCHCVTKLLSSFTTYDFLLAFVKKAIKKTNILFIHCFCDMGIDVLKLTYFLLYSRKIQS